MTSVVFETELLFARLWNVDEDAEAAFAIYGDPEVVRYIGNDLMADVSKMRERLSMVVARNARWGGRFGSWALIEKSTGELVGGALLKPLPLSGTGDFSEDIEIGWHLGRRHWGRGLATEAGRALCAYGFDVLGLDKLHAVIDAPNARSIAVARRLGMRHVGTTGRWYDHDVEHFELAADEYGERRAGT